MEKKQLEVFKNQLLRMRQQIISSGLINRSEELHTPEEDLSDESDLATSIINQQLSCSIRERELLKLKRIDMALDRIAEGNFGHCQECEEAIGLKRLENQPWAELCIVHAEEKEREEARFFRQA